MRVCDGGVRYLNWDERGSASGRAPVPAALGAPSRARAPQLEHNGIDVIDEVSGYVLNGSVCFSETAWPFSQSYAGGSVAAAQSLSQGVADVAIHLAGGQNHARRDCASGFSYVNDSVLATLALLKTHERVLFVSLDAHHASGVEEAFYATDKVLVVSLHRYREGFFPGSGGAKDAGEGAGKHHTINLPLSDGLTADSFVGVSAPAVPAAAGWFQSKGVGPERGGLDMSWPQPQLMPAMGMSSHALAAKIWTELAPLEPPHM